MEESGVLSGNELTMKRRMIFGYLLHSCGKSFLIYVVIALIATLNYTHYLETNKWQAMWNGLESFLVSQNNILESNSDYIASQSNLLRAMEMYLRQTTYNNKSTNATNEKTRIYAITPTFTRPVQKAELTRLSQTFQLVPNFHWIIVEDSSERTKLVSRLLKESSLMTYTHLATATPPNYKLGKDDPNWKKPRGVEQRNAALRWLRKNCDSSDNGVVFFADDDNTYSVKLFQEMRKIQKVGVWPVGLVGGLMVEKPICDNVTNKVVGFNAAWKPNRPFPIDMAGFAINLKLLLENKDALFSYDVESGYQESEILRHIVTKDELEPLADSCTKVYVWHTRTEPPRLSVEQSLIKKGMRSDFGIEV
ncbi:PREDICTED: galactosylgalactosylxylosylprotein 3-beta-glucuronosyltransferase I isoform X2 [Polistes canadensis]|nr:PREDICTED: galactosylgalactosylxylosylprotein 3-beta-glucuronosyltransferase I isoform X2 [Polistes canadensis]